MDHTASWLKVTLAWIGVFVAGVTLSQLAAVLTIVLTLVTIYKHIHDMRRQSRRDAVEAAEAAVQKLINQKENTP